VTDDGEITLARGDGHGRTMAMDTRKSKRRGKLKP
jgi:hypothetical protein